MASVTHLARLPPFTDPPLWEQWLFVNPWPLMVVLIAVAVLLRVAAVRCGRPRLRLAGYAAAGLALGVYASTALVTTQREQADRATRALLQATVDADVAAITRAIAPDAALTDADGDPMAAIGPLRGEVATAISRYPIEFHRINDLVALPDGPNRTLVRLDLRTTFRQNSVPNATIWVFTWQRSGPGAAWQLVEARWLQWQNQRPPGAVWR